MLFKIKFIPVEITFDLISKQNRPLVVILAKVYYSGNSKHALVAASALATNVTTPKLVIALLYGLLSSRGISGSFSA